MPTVLVQGQAIEVDTAEYYLYWYRFVQMLVYLTGYLSYFPNTDGERELEESISFLQTNLEKFGDEELKEQATVLMEILKALPSAHLSMLNDVIPQLKINNLQSSTGKRQLKLKWQKLIAGQAPTEEMKQALKTLQVYADWFFHQTQEITKHKEQFQERIVKINPEVIERLGNS